MEATRISVTELAKSLQDVMARVRTNREHFCVVDGGVVIAEIRPGPKGFTVADFRREFGDEFVPKGMARSIEESRQVLRMGSEPIWCPDDDD